MTIKELQYIITVYDKGGFSPASQTLFISQSALSQSIRKVERELGMELFTYLGNRIVPTDACTHLVNTGRPILTSWLEYEKEMDLYAKNKQSELTVGMNAYMMKYFRPYLLREYSARFPNVKIHFIEEHSTDLGELVLKQALDLAIVRYYLDSYPNLTLKPLFPTQLLLAVPQSHPFAQAHPFKGLDELETVSLSEFKDEPFVVMKGSRFSQKFDTFFQEAHFTPNVYAASYTWENRKDYVRNGDALTFLDEIMVAHEPDSDRIAYYRMKSPTKFYNLAVIHRSYNQLPSHIQGFIEVAKDYSKYLIKDDSTE